MNNVEAGRASIEEGSEEHYIFHASLILSQWKNATESSNLIYWYHLKVGEEYNIQKSTKNEINKNITSLDIVNTDAWGPKQIYNIRCYSIRDKMLICRIHSARVTASVWNLCW